MSGLVIAGYFLFFLRSPVLFKAKDKYSFWQLVNIQSLILQIKYHPLTMESLGEPGTSVK